MESEVVRQTKKKKLLKLDRINSEHKVILAKGLFLRAMPDKVRIMARTVTGLPVEQALNSLKFSPTKSARLIFKVLASAVANANKNYNRDVDELMVKSILVDRGPMFKRIHPCAHGRAKPILKRTCHITVIVD
ncbi:MAG: 50S ribosomal protein L22 [Deltaproteobacteria bacterium]|jgi:large subunit ribosomal protein L22|nr:50S ribosomal protein L22 [Deltaproteobacteria bacterium]